MALVAIDTDSESELVVTSSKPVVELEESDEIEEQTLAEELEAKVEAGNASKRLERRMKRKSDREAKEIFDNLSKNLPPIPLPGELPLVAEIPSPEEIEVSATQVAENYRRFHYHLYLCLRKDCRCHLHQVNCLCHQHREHYRYFQGCQPAKNGYM